MKAASLVGERYGRLTVLSRNGTAHNGSAAWLCQCKCGRKTTVSGQSLRRGLTKSCGCFRSEEAAKRIEARRMAYQRWKEKPAQTVDLGPDLAPLLERARAALAKEWGKDSVSNQPE